MKSAEASKTRTRVSFPGHEVKESPASLFTPPVTLRRNIGGVAELSLNASGAPIFALMNGGGGLTCSVLISAQDYIKINIADVKSTGQNV